MTTSSDFRSPLPEYQAASRLPSAVSTTHDAWLCFGSGGKMCDAFRAWWRGHGLSPPSDKMTPRVSSQPLTLQRIAIRSASPGPGARIRRDDESTVERVDGQAANSPALELLMLARDDTSDDPIEVDVDSIRPGIGKLDASDRHQDVDSGRRTPRVVEEAFRGKVGFCQVDERSANFSSV